MWIKLPFLYRGQIFDASHHAKRHLASFGRRVRARIQRRAKRLADFPHTIFQLVPLEEDDEHGLVHFITLKKCIKEPVRIAVREQNDKICSGGSCFLNKKSKI